MDNYAKSCIALADIGHLIRGAGTMGAVGAIAPTTSWPNYIYI